MPPTHRLVASALATLALTSVHHVYGGIVYDTPWRVHGALVAVALGGLIIELYRRGARRMLVAVVIITCVVAIGAFEGLYNHAVKNALYFAGAPHAWLVRLFPPPTYELPDDAFFEITGVAQAIAGGFAAAACLAVMREGGRRRLVVGARIPARQLVAVTGETIALPDPLRLTHLQFRRFAGCPICNLHLRSFTRRHAELVGAGICEVVVFHSSSAEVRPYTAELPFCVLADPDRQLYTAFGVETGARSLLDPRVWPIIVAAVARSLVAIVRGRERAPSLLPRGGRWGLPADFLIDGDGRIASCHYGVHAGDQWSVDDVLAHARNSVDSTATRGRQKEP
ncbi:MAG: peroxiredoxin-like family protein [Kofleriaceae bacterium]